MELVNTGRRVRNPLQHKGFRRFQNCRHRPQQTRKYQVRTRLSYCKAHGIRLSGPALGRPKKGETRDKAQDDRDECERVEVERRFTLAKRKCGMSVLVLNLRKIQRALLRILTYLLEILAQNKNWALVQ